MNKFDDHFTNIKCSMTPHSFCKNVATLDAQENILEASPHLSRP